MGDIPTKNAMDNFDAPQTAYKVVSNKKPKEILSRIKKLEVLYNQLDRSKETILSQLKVLKKSEVVYEKKMELRKRKLDEKNQNEEKQKTINALEMTNGQVPELSLEDFLNDPGEKSSCLDVFSPQDDDECCDFEMMPSSNSKSTEPAPSISGLSHLSSIPEVKSEASPHISLPDLSMNCTTQNELQTRNDLERFVDVGKTSDTLNNPLEILRGYIHNEFHENGLSQYLSKEDEDYDDLEEDEN